MALDSYRELIDEMASGPSTLREAASSAPEGSEEAAEIVAGLAAAEEFNLNRIVTIMNAQQPALHEAAAKVAERTQELLASGVESNITHFGETRGEVVSQLMSMTLADWDRKGLHPTRGTISIEEMIEEILDNDTDQIARLEDLAG